jgi:hypothetical protein
LELFPFFHQIFKILILFVLYFKNYKRHMASLNCKNVQHVKIYLPCNFEVNPITHFDRLCKLEKRGMKLKKNLLLPLKLLSQSQPHYAEMILGWSPFIIVSISAVLYPRWLPLLKIVISSNGQNSSILRQKVPKFELYKHNDELFNIYYGIFLWTLNFYRVWPIMQIRKKGGGGWN